MVAENGIVEVTDELSIVVLLDSAVVMLGKRSDDSRFYGAEHWRTLEAKAESHAS